MNKLYSKINLLSNSYYIELAEKKGENILTIDLKNDDFYDSLKNYCENNKIDLTDISDDEFNACVELLEDCAKNQNGVLTFSISK